MKSGSGRSGRREGGLTFKAYRAGVGVQVLLVFYWSTWVYVGDTVLLHGL